MSELLILDVSMSVWITMFLAIFIASLIVVKKPWKFANLEKEIDNEEPEPFFRPYLYLFISIAAVAYSLMAVAIEALNGWGLGGYIADPSPWGLIIIFIATLFFVAVSQDKVKLYIDMYQKELKLKGLWFPMLGHIVPKAEEPQPEAVPEVPDESKNFND